MTVKEAVKVGKHLATRNFGYGQDDRTSAWNDNGKLGIAGLREPGDTDCSFSTALAYYLGGIIPRSVLKGSFYTGNAANVLAKTGMFHRINVQKLTLDQIKAKSKTGDSIVGPGHMMFCVGPNQWVSFETTEKGTSTGGKKGDQTGREGRIRGLYLRGSSSRTKGKSKTGWVDLLRPKSRDTFMAMILAAYANGKSYATLAEYIDRVAPWDGPRFKWFMDSWKKWDKGVELSIATSPVVPQSGHAFVVLGSTAAKMDRRLKAGLSAFKANPNSKIVVTGAPLRGGVTEAEYMKQWLIKNGIAASRIIVENKAKSTVGNALYSVPLMVKAGITSYTLVSDASHLRRAQIEFLAARVKAEMINNKKLKLVTAGLLAFNDYGSKPIKPTLPVDDQSRRNVAYEVAVLFGIRDAYKAAL